ncbi:MAG TPA: inorganic phosphate transporter [Planctomycetaceae bacterium]
MTTLLILAAVLALAYANGANDNFKGVATLFGSGTTGYGRALAWATAATFAGAVAAAGLAGTLLARFSGKGLVPDALTAEPAYAAAVALGAAATVLLATRVGLPVSTTHALVGALAGAGLAAGAAVDGVKLASLLALPLLVSPLLSLTLTATLAVATRFVGARLGVTGGECVCIEPAVEPTPAQVTALQPSVAVRVDETENCRARSGGRILGVTLAGTVDRLHYLSAGAVSFARGMNDAPKVAAPLLLVPLAGGNVGWLAILLTAAAMAAGGLISARRVAETMSRKITPMTPGTGLAANAVTAAVVLAASPLGLPVSTTHVSCGALFGLGAANGQARLGTIGTILAAWLTTLPLGAACGAGVMLALA